MLGQPTHIMNDKSSCIDLLFTTNSKLLYDVGVEQTIYNKCHHNIIYVSLNLNIPLPPPYYREVWDYKNTYAVCTQRAILLVNWNDAFSKKTTDERVSLNNILLSIFRNYIPNKVIKFDYKYPNRMNPEIISSLRNRSKSTKIYFSNPTEKSKNLLTAKSNECSKMIVEAEERYTNKLSTKLMILPQCQRHIGQF